MQRSVSLLDVGRERATRQKSLSVSEFLSVLRLEPQQKGHNNQPWKASSSVGGPGPRRAGLRVS